jgi:2-(1,2-epoxy-1,2-dihydrophenyl)acetyl-CoA isomerase
MPKPVAVLDSVAASAGNNRAVHDLPHKHPQLFRHGLRAHRHVGDFGGSHLTQLVGPSRARELYLLSEGIDAESALALGLLNRLVPVAGLPAALEQLLARSQAVPVAACSHIKANLNSR